MNMLPDVALESAGRGRLSAAWGGGFGPMVGNQECR